MATTISRRGTKEHGIPIPEDASMKIHFLLAATASVAFSHLALAETVNSSAELLINPKTSNYLSSDSMAGAMYRTGIEQDRKLGLQQGCPSKHKVTPIGFVVLSPIEFPDDKENPIKGVWKVRYSFERCGDTKVYNAIFAANPDGTVPAIQPYFPGSTRADPRLIKDAMTSAMVNALVRTGLKDCKDIQTFDMRVDEAPHDVIEGNRTTKGVWRETWEFKVCGQTANVPMTFIPDANGGGTTYTAHYGNTASIDASASKPTPARIFPPATDHVPLDQVHIESRYSAVDLTMDNIAEEVRKCIPQMEVTNDMLKNFPSSNITAYGHATTSRQFVFSKTTGLCLETSSANYPILAAETFFDTINPSGVPPDVLDKWYKQIAYLIASKGMATVAYKFAAGNAALVRYWTERLPNFELFYTREFKKAGEWNAEDVDATFSYSTLSGISEVKRAGKNLKFFPLAHRTR